jgi:hypothetical protein
MKKFRFCFCAFLSLIGLMFLSSSAFALQYGDITYTVNADSTVTITGYTGAGGAVVIPDIIDGMSVVSIGSNAFYNLTSLTSVIIPDSVMSIGNAAFRGCNSLTSVTIGNSVTSIGNYAFSNCSGLTSVIIGSSVTNIGSYAFYNCTHLSSVTIPDSVTSIGSYAFEYCSGLTSVTIGNSVTSIGDFAFDECTSLTSVNIPDSVTRIGDYAFAYCDRLTRAYFPGNAPAMGSCVFCLCGWLYENFSICYTAGATGFTTPTWHDYPASVCGTTLIELSSFTATPKAGKDILQWSTESEIDNAGFNLYRSESKDGEYTKINTSLIPAEGFSTQGASYEFIDNNVQNRKAYYYKLEDIDLNGQSTMHGPVSATPRLIYGVVK